MTEEESPHDESLREALRQEELQEAGRRKFFYEDVEVMLRNGFLDGYYGFIIARNTAVYTFQKYNKLRQLHLNSKFS